MEAPAAERIVPVMDTTGSEYWDSDRATFEDELDAFRERTALRPVAAPRPGARRAAALPSRQTARTKNRKESPRCRIRSIHRTRSVVARS